jgi:C-terminal processing protease CtpA/Prc
MLNHLSRDTLLSARFQIPQYTHPDQKQLVGYEMSRTEFAPRSPRVDGQVVFLTDTRAISAAETFMGIVKHYDLGTIVGQPTAGANGNINRTSLVGDWAVIWTGMRVRKHDGSQHHLVGIRPDVEAERTIKGIRSGRDEVLEKALKLIRSD